MKILLVLTLGLAVVTAIPYNPQRIIGGSVTNIKTYPFGAALLFSRYGVYFNQACGGTILNSRSILTAAHCCGPDETKNWRVRVGSTNASSGGVVHEIRTILNHPSYNPFTSENDVGILQASINFVFNDNVRAGSIAGPNYNLADNDVVWAIGWGRTSPDDPLSEQLRHVQLWVVNQTVCRNRYAEISLTVTDDMVCSGWLDVGGRDQCQGDSGSPLIHNNIIVGICSWGDTCGQARYPGVNIRVSSHSNWIQQNV